MSTQSICAEREALVCEDMRGQHLLVSNTLAGCDVAKSSLLNTYNWTNPLPLFLPQIEEKRNFTPQFQAESQRHNHLSVWTLNGLNVCPKGICQAHLAVWPGAGEWEEQTEDPADRRP